MRRLTVAKTVNLLRNNVVMATNITTWRLCVLCHWEKP